MQAAAGVRSALVIQPTIEEGTNTLMRFQDIIGQPAACTGLQHAYANGRLSHAYIFDGPDGVGKRTTALALAALLLCEAPEEADACGHCAACGQVAAGTHPDLYQLAPDGKSIKIRQIRDLRARLADMAVYGGYTVVIIDAAETMTLEAANAFLKTVEEPVGPTCFILVTSQAERLPETIRSRAQLVRFHSLSEAALCQLLGPAAERPDGRLAASLAEGSIARAQALLADETRRQTLLDRRQALEALLAELPTRHDGALLRFADAFTGDRDAVREEVLLIRRLTQARLRDALAGGTDLALPLAILHDTTRALARLERNTEPAFILGALLIEMAHHSRQ